MPKFNVSKIHWKSNSYKKFETQFWVVLYNLWILIYRNHIKCCPFADTSIANISHSIEEEIRFKRVTKAIRATDLAAY